MLLTLKTSSRRLRGTKIQIWHCSVALKVDDGDAKAVAMAKGNDKLKEAVNKVIKKLKDNGTYDEYIKDASKYQQLNKRS